MVGLLGCTNWLGDITNLKDTTVLSEVKWLAYALFRTYLTNCGVSYFRTLLQQQLGTQNLPRHSIQFVKSKLNVANRKNIVPEVSLSKKYANIGFKIQREAQAYELGKTCNVLYHLIQFLQFSSLTRWNQHLLAWVVVYVSSRRNHHHQPHQPPYNSNQKGDILKSRQNKIK